MKTKRILRIELRSRLGELGSWSPALAERLRQKGHIVRLAHAPGAPTPPGLHLLMQLERMIYRRAAPPQDARPTAPALEDAGTPDLMIDLTGADPGPVAQLSLKPLYDLRASEVAAADALLDRRAPQIDLMLTEPGEAARCVASATPALENRDLFLAGLRAVGAALASVVESAVDRLARGEALPSVDPASATSARRASPTQFALGALGAKIENRLTRLAVHREHFRIGWRRPAPGQTMADTLSWPDQPYSFLPDDGRRYLADPFVFAHGGKTFLFCEEFPYATGKGVLTAFELREDGSVGPAVPVMEQPWHLSYPQVFARDGEIWMIPESCAANRIELYRATRFPDCWTREAILVDDTPASDATLVEHGGRLWLFATVARDGLSSWDALHIYYADHLTGPWRAHPANPALIDAGCARPAGAMFLRNGELWRPAQDCSRGYGYGLTLCSVERLDEEAFRQTPRMRIAPPRNLGHGAHTLNYAAGIETIDVVGARRRG
jgi:hypothetical protein